MNSPTKLLGRTGGLKYKHTRVRVAEPIHALFVCLHYGVRFPEKEFEDFSGKEIEAVQRMVMAYPELRLFSTTERSKLHINRVVQKPAHLSLWQDENNPCRENAVRALEDCCCD